MEFIKHRIELWDKLYAQQKTENNHLITVNYNGDEFEFLENTCIPIDIAKKYKVKNVIACKINGKLSDIWYPLSESCTLEFVKTTDPEGQHVLWHSSAHILGQALEQKYGCTLSVGPALNTGFYYEGSLPGNQTIKQEDFAEIEELMLQIVKENQKFQKLVISKKDALQMFKYNKYKQHIITNNITDDQVCTVYRCGNFIDLCRGPHIISTSVVGAIKPMSVSSSYFLGDKNNDSLQRIYGISFTNRKEMKLYLRQLEEAKKRDHRVIGEKQKLFHFERSSPGCCYFLPHGTRLYNRLLDFLKKEYWNRGFQEVMTPAMCHKELWEISGHWQKYKENMFNFQDDHETHAICSMNCPKHCLIFKNSVSSYRELPIRYADFGPLHRNELRGALTGLTRCRQFHQDDAHIFCTNEQIESEIANCFDFLDYTYKILGYEYDLELSTRPKEYIGDLDVWNIAEEQLKTALINNNRPWKLNEGDGAFYGPKIDIHIKDALGRSHQCATIQLDFNLPERFNLSYTDEHGKLVKPVIIHRAIYGSFERFIAILIEHYAGKFPFWLCPRQVIILPISDKFIDYAKSIQKLIHKAGYYVDTDLSDNKLDKKVREAQLMQYHHILVVGQVEKDNNTVNVRYRDNKTRKSMTIDELFVELSDLTIKKN